MIQENREILCVAWGILEGLAVNASEEIRGTILLVGDMIEEVLDNDRLNNLCCQSEKVSPCEEGIYEGCPGEELPEDVMSLEDTLKSFEYCDMYCDGYERACSKCPNRNMDDPNECRGLTPLIKSGFFHLNRYAKCE